MGFAPILCEYGSLANFERARARRTVPVRKIHLQKYVGQRFACGRLDLMSFGSPDPSVTTCRKCRGTLKWKLASESAEERRARRATAHPKARR